MTRQEEKQQLRAIVRRLEAALTPEYKTKSSRAIVRRLLAGPMERLDPDALRCPPLCALGRQSLPVYMLHQPGVYGVLLGGAALLGR